MTEFFDEKKQQTQIAKVIIETEEVYTKETNNNEEEKIENEKGFMAHNNDLGPPNPNPDFKWQFILI